MKTLGKLLVVFVGLFIVTPTIAQNTGVNPFVGSTHDYTITRGIAGSTLAWTVLDKDGNTLVPATDYYTAVNTDQETVSITWVKANDPGENYIVQLTETRIFSAPEQAAGAPAVGCPTIRQIPVTVEANSFDVIAELISDAKECATLNANPVVDVDTDGDGAKLGDNSDDVFGKTTRQFKVKMTGGDITRDWSFEYSLSDLTAFKLGGITGITYSAGATETAGTGGKTKLSIDAGTVLKDIDGNPYVTIEISFNTNKNIDGTNGQDPDVTLELAISDAQDELGTPDSDELAASNIVTYTIYAVPATTGITTD